MRRLPRAVGGVLRRLPLVSHPSRTRPRDRGARSTRGERVVAAAAAVDYNLGNVVRFVLERHEGNEIENLRTAHTYLERAIQRLEG